MKFSEHIMQAIKIFRNIADPKMHARHKSLHFSQSLKTRKHFGSRKYIVLTYAINDIGLLKPADTCGVNIILPL